MEGLSVKGQGEAPTSWMQAAGASCLADVGGESVSLATRGQADMRGLDTAGRVVRQEQFRVSRVERHRARWAWLLIAASRVAPRAVTTGGGRRRDDQ